jgi:hypothetical protein
LCPIDDDSSFLVFFPSTNECHSFPDIRLECD